MERFFRLKERGTNVRTEFIAGMTTFFSMVYILMVNADMFFNPSPDLVNPLGVSYGAIYIATVISAVVGTVLAGLLANLPLAQASGMGLAAVRGDAGADALSAYQTEYSPGSGTFCAAPFLLRQKESAPPEGERSDHQQRLQPQRIRPKGWILCFLRCLRLQIRSFTFM